MDVNIAPGGGCQRRPRCAAPLLLASFRVQMALTVSEQSCSCVMGFIIIIIIIKYFFFTFKFKTVWREDYRVTTA